MAIDDRDRERSTERFGERSGSGAGEGFFERAWRRLSQRTQGDEPDEDRRRRESSEQRSSPWSGEGASFYGPSGADYGRTRSLGEGPATQGSYGLGGYAGQGSFSGQSYGSPGYNQQPSQGYGARYGTPEYGGGYQRTGGYGEGNRDYGRDWGRDWGREQPREGRREGGQEYGGYAPFEGRAAHHWRREPVKAGEIMTSEIKFVSPDATLKDIAVMMKDENVGAVPVVGENRKLQGMITDRDIVVRGAAEGKPFHETRARDIMTTDVEAVTSGEDIRDVIDLMGRHQVRRVPVVDREDRLLGIISIADVASRADYDEELQQALEKISSRRSFWSRLWT